MSEPIISLIHATRGRPEKALACQKLWMERVLHGGQVELITVVDSDDKGSIDGLPCDVVVAPGGGCVRAWNEGAKKARGQIIIQLSDDWVPPQNWDDLILSRIGDVTRSRVLAISDGHRTDRLLCMAIMTRTRYIEQGYMFHPRFKSVYSDDFFTEMAYRDPGVVIEARDLVFEHQHPGHGYGKIDAVTAESNSGERYAQGKLALDILLNYMSIGFTACDRPDYLERSLESWIHSDFSKVGAVHFFVEPSPMKDRVIGVIQDFLSKVACPVIIHHNPQKNGVLRNPWVLFDNMFRVQGAPFVVLAEDDFTVSDDIVRWMEWCHDNVINFSERNTILAACAKNHAHSVFAPDQSCITPAFGGNIWGTWRHHWETYLRDTWDFDYSTGTKVRGHVENGGWDWNIGSRIMPQNKLSCVMPVNSRSYHIGVKGVHTLPQHYDMTVVTNFVAHVDKNVEYKLVDVPSEENPATYVPMPEEPTGSGLNITTAGDIGDVIYLLAIIRSIPNGPHTLLLRDSGGTRGIMAQASNIERLLRKQSCLADVRPYQRGDRVHWVSEGFRKTYVIGGTSTLLEAHACHAKTAGVISFIERGAKPWLTGIEPRAAFKDKVVINRTGRYHGQCFPWREIIEHYGDRLVFVGQIGEYMNFCKEFEVTVEHCPTVDLLDLAEIIAGSALFIGNQSCSFAIAEGLKHPAILEVYLQQPDCMFLRDNAQMCYNGGCFLPNIFGSGELLIKPPLPKLTTVTTQTGAPNGWQYKGKVMGNGFSGATARMMALPEFRGVERKLVEKALVADNVARCPEFFARQDGSNPFALAIEAIRHAQKVSLVKS